VTGPPRSIVVHYYAYVAASSLGSFLPVWVVFLELQGLTFTQIPTLDALFFAAIVVAEVPTGYSGDRIGRRNALVVSSLVLGVAAAAFGFADSFETFLADYLLWAVAQTFRSGTDSV
jgi:MFS family permease